MSTARGPLPPLAIDTTDELLGSIPEADVVAALTVRPGTLATWRRRGAGPPSFKLGRFLRLYPLRSLHQWWVSPEAARTRRLVQLRKSRAHAAPQQGQP
jgi:hypothetical protein